MRLQRDLVRSTRRLAASPGFTLVVVFSLALAIGANTAVFSLVNGLLLRPLPVEEPERLARLYSSFDDGPRWASVSYPNFRDYRRDNKVFSGLAAERPVGLVADGEAGNEKILGSLVTSNYFSVLGVEASRGRTFAEVAGDGEVRRPLAVVSHGLWQRRFGGGEVLGRTLTLNGQPFEVVGVAPRDFAGTNVILSPEVWLPITFQPVALPGRDLLESRGTNWLSVTGRLRPGVDLEQARTTMEALAARLREVHPRTMEGMGVSLLSEAEASIPPQFRGTLLALSILLQVAVGLVLLVACVNAAGLFLARAAVRQREMGIRAALGANRRRLLWQMLSESMLLASLAGAAGLLIGGLLARGASSIRLPLQVPLSFDLGLDLRVLAFTVVVTLAAGLLFGIVPALQASRPNVVAALKEGSGRGSGRSRVRKVLLVAQVAVAFVLLVAAGLFFRSLRHTQSVDPGFRVEGELVASVNLGVRDWDEGERARFYRRLLVRLGEEPQVRSASLAVALPFDVVSHTISASPLGATGAVDPEGEILDYNVVGPAYFETLGIEVLEGRSFELRDDSTAAPVAMVNRSLAERYWPGDEAVGRQVRAGGGEPRRVIGVVEDGLFASLGGEPRPFLYLPILQDPQPVAHVHVSSRGGALEAAGPLRRTVRGMDPDVLLYDLRPLARQVDTALLPARLAGGLLAGLGLLALVLATVGLYAATAYSLSRRTREIGIRMALGGRIGDILRLVVREGMVVALVGLVAGWFLVVPSVGLVEDLLQGVDERDLLTYAAASVILLVVAFAANLIPARRITRIDPKIALDAE